MENSVSFPDYVEDEAGRLYEASENGLLFVGQVVDGVFSEYLNAEVI